MSCYKCVVNNNAVSSVVGTSVRSIFCLCNIQASFATFAVSFRCSAKRNVLKADAKIDAVNTMFSFLSDCFAFAARPTFQRKYFLQQTFGDESLFELLFSKRSHPCLCYQYSVAS